MEEISKKDALNSSEILNVLNQGRKVSVGEKWSLGLVQFGKAYLF